MVISFLADDSIFWFIEWLKIDIQNPLSKIKQ